jgi:hypothetical protein
VRRKIAVAIAAGTVALSGFALAGPALAAVGADTASSAVTSRTDKIKQALAGLVSDKTLTQAQADKVASTLGSADLGPGGFGGGRGGPGGHGFGNDLATAAKALGVTEADLRTALQGGKTLAQVAKDKNVSVDKVIAALVAEEKTRIAKEVTDGRLTRAEADKRLADLTARVTERVNSARPEHARGDRPGPQPSASASAAPSS